MIARSNTHVVAIGLAPSRRHPVFIGPGAAEVSFFTPLQLQIQPHEFYIHISVLRAASGSKESPQAWTVQQRTASFSLTNNSIESLTNPSSLYPHEGSNEMVVEVSRSRVAVYKWK